MVNNPSPYVSWEAPYATEIVLESHCCGKLKICLVCLRKEFLIVKECKMFYVLTC